MGSDRPACAWVTGTSARQGSWAASVTAAVERIKASDRSTGALLDALIGSVSGLLDSPVGVALIEDGLLVRRAATGDGRPGLGGVVDVVGTICGQALISGLPVRVADTLAPGADGPDGRCCLGGRSALSVPLVHGVDVLGVVCMTAEQPDWFDDVDENTLSVLAAAAAAVLAAMPPMVESDAALPPRPAGRQETPQVPAQPGPGGHPPGQLPDQTPGPWKAQHVAGTFPDPTGPGGGPEGAEEPALGLVLWQWDALTGATHCPAALCELLGLPAGTPAGLHTVREALHPHDVPRFDEAVLRHADHHQGVEGTFRVITAGGDVRRLHAWSELRTRGGQVLGAFGAVLDVSARSREQATLRSSLAGLAAAQELTGVGLWEWCPATDELSWSREMFALVGLDQGAITPTLAHWHHFVHPEDLDRARALDVRATERVGPRTETFRVIGADGTLRYIRAWSRATMPDADGNRTVCGAALDVTVPLHDRAMIERLSATDAVTGLGNRLAFDGRITELLADPSRDVALLLLDLDRFKLVNDSLGHQVGDRLLVEVANRLAGVVPSGSITSRMGGDEFVVVPQPGIGWLQVRRLAQAIVEALRMPYLVPDSGEMLVCPVSVGVTSTSGRQVTVDDLLSEADLALYEAKDSGRDRYVVFDDGLRARARNRHLAERNLRSALEDGRMVLQYQPIVDLGTRRIVGCEALVRIRDLEADRLLPPDTFIEVAEDTGLVVEVDCWVIDTALAQVHSWAEQHRGRNRPPWLAINVSPRSMEHPPVVKRLLDGLEQRRLPPNLIKVELTEHSFLGTLPGSDTSLRQLIGSGVPVGIDDFGTGYSALAYLQRFDLDFMKIDRSFVASVGDQERADAVVTAIVDLAHAHGMQVTAEGIENARQAQRLREIGCDLAQGYHFGRPGEAARILSR